MMPERLLTGPGRLKKRSKFKGQKNAYCAVCNGTCSYQLRSKERAKLVPRLPLPAPGSGLAATRLAEHPPAVFPFAMGSGGEKGAAKGSSGRHTDNPCKHRMAAPDKFQAYLNRPPNRERQKTRQPGFDNARRKIFSRLIVLFKAWLIAPWNRGMNQKRGKPDDNVPECHSVFRAFIHHSRRQFNSPCLEATGVWPLAYWARLQPPHSAGLFTMSQ